MVVNKGVVLSEGVAMGRIHLINEIKIGAKAVSLETEKDKLKTGILKTIEELKKLKNTNWDNQEYLDFQIMLLQDPALVGESISLIEQEFSAIQSIIKVLHLHQSEMKASSSLYLQQRAIDLSDIEQRIVRNIMGTPYVTLDEKFILYAEELPPSYLIQNKQSLLGVITRTGGDSSHGAILCRQFNIPYIIATIEGKEGEWAVIDTRKQQILQRLNQKTISHYEKIINEFSLETFHAISHPGYQFLANVSSNVELDKVLEYGFDGVGLYRTEMIFMNTNCPLTYEEQYEIYKEAIEKLKGKPICFRTFDIGDDKQLPYVKAFHKGIDNYKNNPELFTTQIKAILTANTYGNVKIMFPMVTSFQEYEFLKDWVYKIKADLHNESKIEIGIMLETKSALNSIWDFKSVDFISIGTNDLVLDIYHIHRDTQAKVMKEYLKDLVSKLSEVVAFCDLNHIDLSICGELAAITTALKKFMKIGVKNFSVATPAIRVLNKIYKEV